MRHRHADPNGSGRPETNVAVEFEADRLLDDPALLIDAHTAAAVQNPIDCRRADARRARDVRGGDLLSHR